jgi:hypothetical protein
VCDATPCDPPAVASPTPMMMMMMMMMMMISCQVGAFWATMGLVATAFYQLLVKTRQDKLGVGANIWAPG